MLKDLIIRGKTKMNYEDFKEQFTDDVMDRLFEQGIEVKIEMREATS